MARKKPYQDYITALETRTGFHGQSVDCYVFPGGTSRGQWKVAGTSQAAPVPAGCTFVVTSDNHPIAWVDKDGGINFTPDIEHPQVRNWKYTTCATSTFRRHIQLAKKHLIDTEAMKAQEDEAIASIMAAFAGRDLVDA